jgi:hypothetical protein
VSGAGPPAIVAGVSLQIGRARLHGAISGDRERLTQQLGEIRPAQIGLAEGAILLVPRMIARKRLSRDGDGARFIASVTDELARTLKRARRPGDARSADDALLFVDEAEAAATLIAQWLTGAAPAERAWWPQLTGGESPPAWLRRHILPDARRLPALIATLARRGLAEALLERLEAEDVRIALAAMAAGCGLSLPTPRARAGSGKAAPETAQALALIEAIVPEVRRAALAPPARLLLLVALLAERRPAMLATRAAGAVFAAVASASPPPPSARPEPRRRREASPATVRERRAQPAEARTFDAPRRQWARSAGSAVDERVEARPSPTGARETRRSDAPRPDRPAATDSAPKPRPSDAPRPDLAAIDSAPEPVEIATEFGGLLFLLNALLALGIYGDFSRPGRVLPGLSPFGLLRLLGRAWFGRPFVEDSLHGLLVALAGGRRADAARAFEARPWSVPRGWLAPWPKAGPALVGGHRLRPMLWHPAGFPLAELDPADPAAAIRAARRLGLRGVPRSARLPALPAPARARWIACLRRYLEARLAKGLDLADPAEAIATLCHRPARVAADNVDVIARFRLDDHPLAIRLAGLDRDSGWIPAARRAFRFAFE